jgi:hypothetical protein
MSLSNPRSIFGLHSVSPYSRTDGTFYGILKVLKSSSLSMSATNVELHGGSQKYAWAVETGEIKAEVSLKVSEYPDFLFTLFLGQAPTVAAASATGTVSTAANKLGTSVVQTVTGIASIAIVPTTGSADLKFGKYVIKAASPTTVDVYMSTDLDSARGAAATYQDDLLKITASPLTITTAGVITAIPGIGVQMVGGSGAIAMVAGDTATFEVLPPSNKSLSVNVGAANSVFPEFGMIAMAQRTGDKRMLELDIYRCKGAGLPFGLQPNAWNEADIKLGVFYDGLKDGVFKARYIEEA